MKTLLLALLLTLNLIAQDNYSMRLAYGKASASTLGEIISFGSKLHEFDYTVIGLDGGYLLKHKLFDKPLDLYLRGGLAEFDESANPAHSDKVYEATLYIKLFYNIDFLDNRIRFGFGEGASYTSNILSVEELEGDIGDNKSYYLNYIDLSLDLDLGRLIHYKPMHNTYVGWALKHRSGIFGLINGVTKGGSNYNTVYLEKNF
ncbi:hypothetical protein [Sulfurimonas sp.]|uniref:hypothetical protein n=1 Tax=Sulfurimonas sp. TaxID=2022749 RepID=UPI0025E46111|nr:hypothetical protein [Sulfurimonas sp.]MBT5934115.1 hypothetical protein [Sulfurimonas sp.]